MWRVVYFVLFPLRHPRLTAVKWLEVGGHLSSAGEATTSTDDDLIPVLSTVHQLTVIVIHRRLNATLAISADVVNVRAAVGGRHGTSYPQQ